MKHVYIFWRGLLLLTLLTTGGLMAQAQNVGIGTNTPNASAALEIVSSTKGVLLPRVANATAIATPAAGLLVYQTGGTPGFYYNAGTSGSPSWQLLATASGAATTASNGLTKTGPNTVLGGTLTAATTVANGGFALNVTGTGSTSFGGNVGVALGATTPAKRLHIDANNDFLRVDNLSPVSNTNNYLVIDNSGNVGKTTVENVAGQLIRLGFNGGNYFENTSNPAFAESALRFDSHNTAALMGNAPNGAANFINTVTGSVIATGQAVTAGNGTLARTTDQITLPAGVYRVTVRLNGNYFVGSANGTTRSGFVKFIVNNNEYSLVETLTAYDNGVTTHAEVSDYLNLSTVSTVDFSVRFLRNFALLDRAIPSGGGGNSYRSLLLIERVR